MKNEIRELIKMSSEIGGCPDFTQGGGGNVSVKSGERKMIIKASGFRLSELREDEGFVSVDRQVIKSYYERNRGKNLVEGENGDDREIVKRSIIRKISSNFLRPSIETGFHALLQKYVLHTHSVYVNICACALEGEGLLRSIIKPFFFRLAWVPYARPGAPLARAIKESLEKFEKEHGFPPEIIILQNHGIIVGSETGERCLALHREINKTLHNTLGKILFPRPEIIQRDNNVYESKNEYLKNFIKEHPERAAQFSKLVLFPDQKVYCENVSAGDGMKNESCKIVIDTESGGITYSAGPKEALAIEETITAWVYIVSAIDRLGLSPRAISERDRENIANMESEAYRKGLLLRHP